MPDDEIGHDLLALFVLDGIPNQVRSAFSATRSPSLIARLSRQSTKFFVTTPTAEVILFG